MGNYEVLGIEYVECSTSNASKADLSNLVEEYKLIPLETKDNALISSVNKIVYKGNKIYILDKLLGLEARIIIFDEQGKNIGVINSIGDGPGEYLDISDFDVHPENGNITVIDPNTKKIVEYDISGNYKKEYKLDPYIKGLRYLQTEEDTRLVLDTRSSMTGNKEDNFKLFLTDEKLNIVKSVFPFQEPVAINMGNGMHLYPVDGTKMGFYSFNTDSIYYIDKTGDFELKYKLKFDKRVIPQEKILQVLAGEVDLRDYVAFVTYFEGPNYLIITFTQNTVQYITIYNKSSRNSITVPAPMNSECATCNSLLNNLSVSGDYFIVNCDNLSLKPLLNMLDPAFKKCLTPSPSKIVNSLTVESNPVLVMVKFSI